MTGRGPNLLWQRGFCTICPVAYMLGSEAALSGHRAVLASSKVTYRDYGWYPLDVAVMANPGKAGLARN